jgi:hypothetical protein
MRTTAVLFSLLLLGGCASSGPLYVEAPPPPAGKAILYVAREATFSGSVGAARFLIDGKPFADLLISGYSYAYLSPGHHEITQFWPLLGNFHVTGESHGSVDAEAGHAYYFRFQTEVGGCPNGQLCVGWGLTPLAPAEGVADLANKHLVAADRAAAGGF